MSTTAPTGMSKHRLDALTDGIFAVAMTLLVIELKIPESAHPADNAALLAILGHLAPKIVAWVISFMVLAFFWWGHHRAFHYARAVDGKLVFLNLVLLAGVSFMPFASALSGEHGRMFASQVVYSGTMLVISVAALLLWRHLYLHPLLCHPVMSEGAWQAARMRTLMLIAISIVAVVIAWFVPSAGNMAFMLMMLSRPLGKRIAARYASSGDADIAQSG